jgi:hypothetical protein
MLRPYTVGGGDFAIVISPFVDAFGFMSVSRNDNLVSLRGTKNVTARNEAAASHDAGDCCAALAMTIARNDAGLSR